MNLPWRLYILGIVLVLALGGTIYVRHLRHANADLKAAVKVETQQATVNQAGAAINDRRAASSAKVHRKAEEGRDAIQQSTDLDRALELYGAAVGRVREQGHAPAQPDAPTDGRRSDPGPRPAAA